MIAVARELRWPSDVWNAPFLRGLDSRARAELEAAGALDSVAAGAVVFRPGEPADALFVVAGGAVSLFDVRRGDAHASVVRRVSRGEVFGEEAVVRTFGVRVCEARADEAAKLVRLPLSVLRRAVGRSGDGDALARLERTLRRQATLDLLRTAGVSRALPEGELLRLLDSVVDVHRARGEAVYRAGDPSDHVYLVADGLLSAQTVDDGRPRIEAYFARGDLFGEEELAQRERRRFDVMASGPSWLLALPAATFSELLRRYPSVLADVARLRASAATPPVQASGRWTTAHVFRDLYRMRVARSLLVIDQDACVRCGHCAWACADAHDDGISRLVRRGDRIVAQVRGEHGRSATTLLVPSSCQHCRNPSCMIDCPTGAIGRDARGEVFVRESLCTGCGNCAKGCPWDNIQMAPRADGRLDANTSPTEGGAREPRPLSADVAVKCDLCSGLGGSPACVASCPTQAIVRIDPNEALVELRVPREEREERSRRPRTGETAPERRDGGRIRGAERDVALPDDAARTMLPTRLPATPWVLAGLAASVGILARPLAPWPSGMAAGCLVLLLAAHGVVKRSPVRITRTFARLGDRPWARVFHVLHLAVGPLAVAAGAAHARLGSGRHVGGAVEALVIAFGVAFVSGVFGALAQAVLPKRLTRLERTVVLPEDLRARGRDLDARSFAELSGRSEVTKVLYAHVLRPYRHARAGALLLVLSGRSLRQEEERLAARIAAHLGGRKSERLVGIDALVRTVVERRSVGAQRLVHVLLRGWLVVHVASVGAALVLALIHVWVTAGAR